MTANPVPERPRATKDDLRREIAELRRIGGQMANVCFNLGQKYDSAAPYVKPFPVLNQDLRSMRDLGLEWDAIKRAEC